MSDHLPTHGIEFRGDEFRQVVYDQSGNGHHVSTQWRSGGKALHATFDALLAGSSMSIEDARKVFVLGASYIVELR